MKKIISIFLTATMLFAQTAFAVGADAGSNDELLTEIHVSPEGRDSNKGTAESPIATFEKARKLVREIRAQKNTSVTVIFHEGTYRMNKTVAFDSNDSGSEQYPITYKAAEGERVIFKGSKSLDTSKFQPVTDPEILQRLPESARGFVGELNLKAQGINTLLEVPYWRSGVHSVQSGNVIFFDDTQQTLARFPNDYFTQPEKITNAATRTFQMKESNITRWGKATDVRVGGYFLNDYRYEREKVTVDSEARTLSLQTTGYKISGSERRYFVYNLLEEIDMPGEYYIDQDTYTLYYYPQNVISDETMEIATLNTTMFKLSDVHYVNFDGLEFAQTSHDAFQLLGCTDIGFEKCYFHDIGNCAIRDYSEVYQSYRTSPNSWRISVKDSVFKNIGLYGVSLQAGDEENLIEGDCVIDNCYFAEGGTGIRSYAPFVNLLGVGTIVKNCTMHNTAVHMIQGGGSLHKILNNEFYDACKETHDVGVIYMGRKHHERGVEVANNYFHHAKCLDESIGIIACGVYMDDSLSEWYIHHNIFEGTPRGVFASGSSTQIHDNIFVDCPMGVRVGWGNTYANWSEVIKTGKEYMEKYPAYLEKFPSMAYMYEPFNPTYKNHNNVVEDNLFVNSGNDSKDDLGELPLYNVSQNNVELESYDGFVDPENGIYDIKDGEEILEDHPGLGEIKTAEMGCTKEMLEYAENLIDKDIIKTYPKNGANGVNAAKVEFSWTKSGIYDKYRIRVARDAAMTDIVIDEVVAYNYYKTTELSADNTTYYWNVEGVDVSQYRKDNKASYGAAYKFSTSKYENTDKLILNNLIAEAKTYADGVNIGSNGGECTAGGKDEFLKAIEGAELISNSKYASQEEVDNAVKALETAKKKFVASRKIEYISIEEYLNNPEGWDYSGSTTTFENGTMHLQDSEYGMYTAKALAGYQMLKFKFKADFDVDWTGFGLREQASGLAYSVGGCGYMLIVKPDIIEFQRYNNGGGMIKVIPNNCIKKNEWCEVEVGALDEEEGIRVILRVNGQTILNELDTEGVITQDGYFKVYNRMSSTGRTDVSADIAPTEEEIKQIDQSIISGKLTAVEPVMADGYETLFKDESAIKTYNASYEKTVDCIKFKGNADSEFGGTLSSYGTVKGNEVFKAKIKFNYGDSWQGIGMRAEESENFGWNINNYIFLVNKNSIDLQRFTEAGQTHLVIADNDYIKDGEFNDMIFGAYPVDEGMRIIVYANGHKIIDYIDPYSKQQSYCVNFYDRMDRGMEIKAAD